MEIGPHTPTEQTTSEYPFSTDQTTFIRGLIEERKALLAGRLDTHKKYGYQIADNVYFLPIKKQMKKIDSELDFLGKVLPTAQNGSLDGVRHFLASTLSSRLPHIGRPSKKDSAPLQEVYVNNLKTLIQANSALTTAQDERADNFRQEIQWQVEDTRKIYGEVFDEATLALI